MRILLLNHYYWPDVSANAQYGAQLAEDLVAAGMEVHTIASRGDYLGQQAVPLPAYERHKGVHIHRIPVTNFGKKTALARVSDAMSFHMMAFLVSMRIPKPDVIVTQTAPLLVVTSAAWIAWLRSARLIVWCQDVWPDIAFALGLFRKNSYSGRVFRFLSYRSMRRADRVAAIGRCMHAYLLNGVGLRPEQVVLHHNWGDSREVYPVPHGENPFRDRLGLNGRFTVLYSGNMGWGHPFDSIMEAARTLADDPRIHFLFIGDGQRKPFVEDYVSRHRLANVTLLPYQPYALLPQTLSAGDVHLVSLDERLDGLIIPSKFYGALAVSRPVIFLGSARNEIAHVLRETGCGLQLPTRDTAALTTAIREAADHAEEWRKKGRNGFTAFRGLYDREAGSARYVELIRTFDDRERIRRFGNGHR